MSGNQAQRCGIVDMEEINIDNSREKMKEIVRQIVNMNKCINGAKERIRGRFASLGHLHPLLTAIESEADVMMSRFKKEDDRMKSEFKRSLTRCIDQIQSLVNEMDMSSNPDDDSQTIAVDMIYAGEEFVKYMNFFRDKASEL